MDSGANILFSLTKDSRGKMRAIGRVREVLGFKAEAGMFLIGDGHFCL